LSLPKATLEKLREAFSVPIRAVPVSGREETDEDLANPEVAIRGRLETWRSAGDFHLLTEPESHFELFAIWKRQSQVESGG
jgi:hypothetical protein